MATSSVGKLLMRNTQRRVPIDVALLEQRTARLRAWSGAAHCDLSVTVMGDAAMRTLNRELRDVDKPTDVLSVSPHRRLRPGRAIPAIAGVFDMGDLYLCAPYIARFAHRHAIPCLQSYAARLVCHGLLHLCGHTHDRAADFAAMHALERDLLTRLAAADAAFRFEFADQFELPSEHQTANDDTRKE